MNFQKVVLIIALVILILLLGLSIWVSLYPSKNKPWPPGGNLCPDGEVPCGSMFGVCYDPTTEDPPPGCSGVQQKNPK